MSFIARYVYTYKEFVIVTDAAQCKRKTATGQDTANTNINIQIYKIGNVQKNHNISYRLLCMYRYDIKVQGSRFLYLSHDKLYRV